MNLLHWVFNFSKNIYFQLIAGLKEFISRCCQEKVILFSMLAIYGLCFGLIYFFEENFKYWFFIIIPILAFLIFIHLKKENQEKPAEVTGLILIVLLNSVTLYFLWLEKHTTNDYKRWENYNYFDEIYVEWLNDMPKKFSDASHKMDWKNISWDNLKNDERAWVRRYFDLYSQEYYFYINQMIPSEMWTVLIHGSEKKCDGAAFLNFCEYPILLEGYAYWKDKGAFMHPKDFRTTLDKKLTYCGYPGKLKCNTKK